MIKRKKVILASLFLLFVSANVFKVLERQSVKQDVLLTDVEAIAACEVSADGLKNDGTCVKDVNTSAEYCVKVSGYWGPVCCATI